MSMYERYRLTLQHDMGTNSEEHPAIDWHPIDDPIFVQQLMPHLAENPPATVIVNWMMDEMKRYILKQLKGDLP